MTRDKDKLSDITEYGLTSGGLPSQSLMEVRKEREGETKPQPKPQPVVMTPYRPAESQAKWRQDLAGNRKRDC